MMFSIELLPSGSSRSLTICDLLKFDFFIGIFSFLIAEYTPSFDFIIWAPQDSNLRPTDYEGMPSGRRFKGLLRWRLFFCPGIPPVSRDSMALRRIWVEPQSSATPALAWISASTLTLIRIGGDVGSPTSRQASSRPSGAASSE